MGFPNSGYHVGGPYNKDYSIWGFGGLHRGLIILGNYHIIPTFFAADSCVSELLGCE